MSVLKVIYRTPLPVLPYDGVERVYALCGLRYGHYVVITEVCELPNRSPFPEETFTVYTSDANVIRHSLTPPEIVLGYAHTHPLPHFNPSDEDIEGIDATMLGLVACGDNHQWYNHKGLLASRTLR